MKQAYILYSCNAWHEHSSKRLLGVFTRPAMLDKFLIAMKKRSLINDNDMDMLLEHFQTQGKNINYMIEMEDLNPKFKK